VKVYQFYRVIIFFVPRILSIYKVLYSLAMRSTLTPLPVWGFDAHFFFENVTKTSAWALTL